MTTLTEIRQALAEYDAKMADPLEAYGYWSSRIEANRYVDAIRLLLPIAEAAKALEMDWLLQAQKEMTHTNEDLQPLKDLAELLKALG